MVQHAAESAFTDDVVSLVIGIIGSLLSLWILFGIKPSLRLTLEVGVPSRKWWKRVEPLARHDRAMRRKKAASPAPEWRRCSARKPGGETPQPRLQRPCKKCGKDYIHYRVEMENLGLATLVEVEARIRLVRKNNTLGTREPVPHDFEKLLELNGKWREARRDGQEITGNRFFHYLLPCKVLPGELGLEDYYLIQVWSKHGFTNFGRLHKIRLRRDPDPGCLFDRFLVEDPDARRRRRAFLAGLATLITRVT
jgi:hypothetical protein